MRDFVAHLGTLKTPAVLTPCTSRSCCDSLCCSSFTDVFVYILLQTCLTFLQNDVLVLAWAGLVQKSSRQMAQERAQFGDAQERFRRAVQRIHATVWQCPLPGLQLHVRCGVQRLGLQTHQSARVQDVSVESKSSRRSIGRSSARIHGPVSPADVLCTADQYVWYVFWVKSESSWQLLLFCVLTTHSGRPPHPNCVWIFENRLIWTKSLTALLFWRGRRNRETWKRGTISGGGVWADKFAGWKSVGRKKESNMSNDKRINSCLSRFDSGVYSFCVLSAILSALIRSPSL